MKALVTGSAGGIGSEICGRLERMILEIAPEQWIGYDGTQAALR